MLLKILSKLGNIYLTVIMAVASYVFVYAYFINGVISWGSLMVLLMMVRELIKKALKVGDMTVTKPFDEMTPVEKVFALTLKFLIFTIWIGFFLLVFYQNGENMDSPYVAIFYVLIVLCIMMDIALYRIRKRNDQFLKGMNM